MIRMCTCTAKLVCSVTSGVLVTTSHDQLIFTMAWWQIVRHGKHCTINIRQFNLMSKESFISCPRRFISCPRSFTCKKHACHGNLCPCIFLKKCSFRNYQQKIVTSAKIWSEQLEGNKIYSKDIDSVFEDNTFFIWK